MVSGFGEQYRAPVGTCPGNQAAQNCWNWSAQSDDVPYPAISHIQYRLTEQDGGTLLKFTHQAMGLIPADLEQNVGKEGGERCWALLNRRRRRSAVRNGFGIANVI